MSCMGNARSLFQGKPSRAAPQPLGSSVEDSLGGGGQHSCPDSHPQICGLQGHLHSPWPRLQEAGSPNGVEVNARPAVIPG